MKGSAVVCLFGAFLTLLRPVSGALCRSDARGLDYDGTISVTSSGTPCQYWTEQTPHHHGYTGVHSIIAGRNYCRNPDRDPNGPWCLTTNPAVRWEYCNVPFCSAPGTLTDPTQCKANVVGTSYRGTLSRTRSGLECQRWDSQTPNPHNYYIADLFPDTTISEVNNYCRNPDEDDGGPWCYTTSRTTRWEYCDVPLCQIVSTSSTTTYRPIGTPVTVSPPPGGCRESVAGREYRGTVSVTRTGRTCQRWDAQFPHVHPFHGMSSDQNYCRNPGEGDPAGLWCFTTDPNYIRDYCEVPLCGVSYGECKVDEQGRGYRGTRAYTTMGLICQRWDSQYPHTHFFFDAAPFPDDTLDETQNFCRNPNGRTGGPWCYTTDVNTVWQYCGVPFCSGLTAPPPSSNDCKRTERGLTFHGPTSTTRSGMTCQRWDSQSPHPHPFVSALNFPDRTLMDAANYCRNPNQRLRPWCYTTSPNTEWEYCDIPFCDNDGDLSQCSQQMDLAIMVDTSGSICDRDPSFIADYDSKTCRNFIMVREFITDLITFLGPVLGPDQVRIALLQFSSTVDIKWTFDNITQDANTLLAAVASRVTYKPYGWTFLGDALLTLQGALFPPQNYINSNRRQVTILISDGRPAPWQQEGQTRTEAENMKLKGLKIYCFGITNDVDLHMLRTISSPPQELNRNYFERPINKGLAPPMDIFRDDICLSDSSRTTPQPTPPKIEEIQPTSEQCTDIVIVLDASGSICDDDPTFNLAHPEWACKNWNTTRDFLEYLVEALPISPAGTHVALVQFATKVEAQWYLSGGYDRMAVIREIAALKYTAFQLTYLAEAIQVARVSMFARQNGGREGVSRTILLVTDARPTEGREASNSEPEARRARSEGIVIFGVGVTSHTDSRFLSLLVSSPFQGPNYAVATHLVQDPSTVARDLVAKLNCPASYVAIQSPSQGTGLSEDCDGPLNLVIVPDLSTTTCAYQNFFNIGQCQDFEDLKAYLLALVQLRSRLAPGVIDSTSIVMPDRLVNTVISLDSGRDVNAVTRAIQSMVYSVGSFQYVSSALRQARNALLAISRPSTQPKAILFITDGLSAASSDEISIIEDFRRYNDIHFIEARVDVMGTKPMTASYPPDCVFFPYFSDMMANLGGIQRRQFCDASMRTTSGHPVPCPTHMNFALVVDMSSNICGAGMTFTCDNFRRLTNFLTLVSQGLDMTRNDGYDVCAVVTTQNFGTVSKSFSDSTSSAQVIIDNLRYQNTVGTSLADGIRMARTEFNALASLGRSGYRDVMLIVTDSSATSPSAANSVLQAANQAKLQGIYVVVVAVSPYNDLFRQMSSSPQMEGLNWFVYSSYFNLPTDPDFVRSYIRGGRRLQNI